MPTDDVHAKVRGFLTGAFQERSLRDDDDVFRLGYANSLFAMQIVEFVEGEFSIDVDAEDLDVANFNTVDSITSLVLRKQGEPLRSTSGQ